MQIATSNASTLHFKLVHAGLMLTGLSIPSLRAQRGNLFSLAATVERLPRFARNDDKQFIVVKVLSSK